MIKRLEKFTVGLAERLALKHTVSVIRATQCTCQKLPCNRCKELERLEKELV